MNAHESHRKSEEPVNVRQLGRRSYVIDVPGYGPVTIRTLSKRQLVNLDELAASFASEVEAPAADRNLAYALSISIREPDPDRFFADAKRFPEVDLIDVVGAALIRLSTQTIEEVS